MKLYYFPLSPKCQKVTALANEVGVSLELAYLDLVQGASKRPEILALNPNGLVPILVDGDFVLWESSAILEYIAAKSGRQDLLPTDLRERADVSRWLAWLDAHLGAAIGRVAFERVVKPLAGRGMPDEARAREGELQAAAHLAVLDKALAGREYLAGRLTIAEFALVPELTIAADCGVEIAKYANVARWLSRLADRPSLRAARAEAVHMMPKSTSRPTQVAL